MIDINKMRRLAQAAMHPVTKGRWIRLFGERTVYDRMEDGCRGIPVVSTPVSPPHPFEAACLDFIAAANPAVISELLDRLEAAESECLEQSRLNGMGASREAALITKLEAAEKELAELRSSMKFRTSLIGRIEAERDALRAKIAAMEKQEPAGYGVRYVEPANGEEDWDSIWMHRVFAEDHIKDFTQAYVDIGEPVGASTVVPLYALPGAKGEEK